LLALQAAKDRDGFLVTGDKFRNHTSRWEQYFGKEAASELKSWCSHHLFPFEFHGDTIFPNAEIMMIALGSRKSQVLKCSSCNCDVALAEDIISSRNPSQFATNPAVTSFNFVKVRKLCLDSSLEHWEFRQKRMESMPTTKDTFFPGYAWSLLFCSNPACFATHQSAKLNVVTSQNLGWRFRLVNDKSDSVVEALYDLLPSEFYCLLQDTIYLEERNKVALLAHIMANTNGNTMPLTKQCKICGLGISKDGYSKRNWQRAVGATCKVCNEAK
jgi:hypothetical protein